MVLPKLAAGDNRFVVGTSVRRPMAARLQDPHFCQSCSGARAVLDFECGEFFRASSEAMTAVLGFPVMLAGLNPPSNPSRALIDRNTGALASTGCDAP